MAEDISILAAGGLVEPGDFLKAIALGATACYSASAIVMALLSDQLDRAAVAMAPPYALILQSTQYLNDEFDRDRSADNVVRLVQAWHEEFDLALRAMGRTSVRQLQPHDLVARKRDLAQSLGPEWVGGPNPGGDTPHVSAGFRHHSTAEREHRVH